MTTKQLDAQELEKIFHEQQYHVTAAVKVYLDIARQCTRRIQEFQDKPGYESQLTQATVRKEQAMHRALEDAAIEKEQHWRFIEDANYFKDAIQQKYGDIDFISNTDDLQRLLEVYRVANLQQELKDSTALEHML